MNSHGCAKRPKPDARTKSGSATRSKNSQRPTRKEGEQTELEQELEVLSNADRISETLTAPRNALDDEQIGVLVQLKASETACRHLEAGYPFAAEAAGRLRSVLEELKDLGASAAAQSERLDADPERLQKIGDRLNTIYSLCQKHRALRISANSSPNRPITKHACKRSRTATKPSPPLRPN